jgi:mannose/fructose/N-acetylgalactosamine-specific phosphotransferase system component IIC
LLFGELGQALWEPFARRRDRWLAGVELSEDPEASRRTLRWLLFPALAGIFAFEALITALSLAAVRTLVPRLASGSWSVPGLGLATWTSLLPAFGIAAVGRLFWVREARRFLVLSAAVVLVLQWIG